MIARRARAARADRRRRRADRRGGRRAGGAGARSCESVPDQELQRAVEPDLRRAARRAERAAGGSGRSASRCPPRAGRSRRRRRSPSGSAGSSPGKTAASATPSKTWPPIVSPVSGTPMIASSISPPADLGLAGGADRGERDDVDLGADAFGARDRLARSARAGSPPAGRGSCDADGRPWSRRTGCGRCAGGRSRRAARRGRRGRRA